MNENKGVFQATRLDNGKGVIGFYFIMRKDGQKHDHHYIIPLSFDFTSERCVNLPKGKQIDDIVVEVERTSVKEYNVPGAYYTH